MTQDVSILSSPLAAALSLAGLALLVLAALRDIAVRLVPNRLPAAIALIGLALRAQDRRLVLGLAAAGIVFLAALLCWRRGWLGGADVKLLGAGALLVAPARVPGFVAGTCIAGAVLALAYAAPHLRHRRRAGFGPRPAGMLRRVMRVERRRLAAGGPLPYAAAIAAAAAAALLRA